MYLEIGLVVLVVVLIILLMLFIPILLQAWRILKDVRMTLATLNHDLPTILKNLEQITTNINNSTAAVDRRIQMISKAVDQSQLIISDIIDNIRCIAPIALKLPIFRKMRKVIAIIKGIRVFINVLLNKEKV